MSMRIMNQSEMITPPSFPCWLSCAQLSVLAGWKIIMSQHIDPISIFFWFGFVIELTGWRGSWTRQSHGSSLPWLFPVSTAKNMFSSISGKREYLWNVRNGTFPISSLGFIILHLLLLQLICTMSNNSWNVQDLMFTERTQMFPRHVRLFLQT